MVLAKNWRANNIPRIGVSKKIEEREERSRLKKIVQQNLPEGMGAIIRTTSEGRQEQEIAKEKELYPKLTHFGLSIKYVDCCYDSRDAQVWMVKVRGVGNDFCFQANTFVKGIPFDSLYDWVMAYLKGEWMNKIVLEQIRMKQESYPCKCQSKIVLS